MHRRGRQGAASQESTPDQTVLLVGGFVASDWLYGQATASLRSHGVEVCRPDGHINKAVSDCGASYCLDRHVKSRVPKAAYGTDVIMKFDATEDCILHADTVREFIQLNVFLIFTTYSHPS